MVVTLLSLTSSALIFLFTPRWLSCAWCSTDPGSPLLKAAPHSARNPCCQACQPVLHPFGPCSVDIAWHLFFHQCPKFTSDAVQKPKHVRAPQLPVPTQPEPCRVRWSSDLVAKLLYFTFTYFTMLRECFKLGIVRFERLMMSPKST